MDKAVPFIGLLAWGSFVVIALSPKSEQLWRRWPSALWGGIVAMIGTLLGLLALPDFSIPARIGLGFIALICTVIFVRRSSTESKEVHEKLDKLHDPFRSELKVRAKNIAANIRARVVVVRVLEGHEQEHLDDWFRWNTNLAGAHRDMVFEFNKNREEVARILSDFETCGVEVPPEIHKSMEGWEQKIGGIETLERYISKTAAAL